MGGLHYILFLLKVLPDLKISQGCLYIKTNKPDNFSLALDLILLIVILFALTSAN